MCNAVWGQRSFQHSWEWRKQRRRKNKGRKKDLEEKTRFENAKSPQAAILFDFISIAGYYAKLWFWEMKENVTQRGCAPYRPRWRQNSESISNQRDCVYGTSRINIKLSTVNTHVREDHILIFGQVRYDALWRRWTTNKTTATRCKLTFNT